MEPGLQSSFIPKDASSATPLPNQRSSGGLSEIGMLLAIVLLVASAALAGAVFLYEQYAQSSSVSKLEQLKRAKEAFEPALIQELTRLDDRMRASETLLSSHVAPIAFFDALQKSTLTTISFQTLDLQATDSQHMTIKINGVAEGVNSIALQADLFSKNGIILNPIFSDISRQADGVHFTLSAIINPESVNYTQLINSASSFQQTTSAAEASPFGSQGTGAPASSGTSQQATLPSGDQSQGAVIPNPTGQVLQPTLPSGTQ